MSIQVAVTSAARSFIDTAYRTAYPTVPILYENAAFDWNSPAPLVVELEVKFYAGAQIGMAFAPRTRTHGCVYVTTYVRKGKGSLANRAMLDWFTDRFQYQAVGAAQLQAAEPEEPATLKDWFCESLKFDFYADET